MDSFLQVFFTKNQLYKIARWRISREKGKIFQGENFCPENDGKFQLKTEAEHILILSYSYAKTPELQWLNTSGWCPFGLAMTWIMATVCPDSGNQLFLSSSS